MTRSVARCRPSRSSSLFLLAWKAIVVITGFPPFILPPPEAVAGRFVSAWLATARSSRTCGRPSSRSRSGSPSARVSAWSSATSSPGASRSNGSLSPYLVAAQATPILALAPLLALWFGPGLLGKVVICALIVFFPVAIATMVGIRSVDDRLLELGRSLRATRRQVLLTARDPGRTAQHLRRAARRGHARGRRRDRRRVGRRRQGLGVLINLARGSLFDIPLMFATLLTIALVGIGLYLVVVAHRAPPGRRPMSATQPMEVPVSQPRSHPRASVALVGLLVAAVVAACTAVPARLRPSCRAPRAARRRRPRRRGAVRVGLDRTAPRRPRPPSGPLTKLTVGLGYIPSVQFAPFYLAQQKGYYDGGRPRGDVPEQDRPRPRPLVGQGAIDVGIADGTSVIPAVSQGIPIQYVATIYGQFPNDRLRQGVVRDQDRGRPQGQEDRAPRAGTARRWIMLQALLASARPDARRRRDRRVPRLRPGRRGRRRARSMPRPASSNNEPVQLELAGEPAPVAPRRRHHAAARARPDRRHDDARDQARRDRGVRGGDAPRDGARSPGDPKVGLDAAITAVPELASARDTQAAILAATIDVVDRAGPGGRRPRRDRRRRLDGVDRRYLTGARPRPEARSPSTTSSRTDLLPAARTDAVLRRPSGRAGRAGRGGCARRWPPRPAAPGIWPAAAPPLRGTTTADVVVVGGGYTGLWTALRLTELAPGARIVLLEADICGGGPSGRNGGFATGWWDELPTLIERHGPDGALAVARAIDDAVDEIGRWCAAQRRRRLVHEGRLAVGERRAGPGRRLAGGRRGVRGARGRRPRTSPSTAAAVAGAGRLAGPPRRRVHARRRDDPAGDASPAACAASCSSAASSIHEGTEVVELDGQRPGALGRLRCRAAPAAPDAAGRAGPAGPGPDHARRPATARSPRGAAVVGAQRLGRGLAVRSGGGS